MNKVSINTKNLVLRQFTLEDVPVLYQLSQEDGMRQYIPDQVYKDEEETEGVVKFLMSQYENPPTPKEAPYVIGVVLKETNELIGHVGLSPLGDSVEIGYAIADKHQGKGYATEAVVAMSRWGLDDLKLSEILGVVDSDNKGSCKVLEKSSYEFVQEKEKKAFGRIGLCSTYKITNKDYL